MGLRDKRSSLDVAPSRILKIVLGLALVLLLMWLFTLSHIDYNQRAESEEYIKTASEADSTQIITGNREDRAKEVQSYDQSSGVFMNGLITFLVLLFVLIIVWFWVDRKESVRSKGPERSLSSQSLGEGATLRIIRINEEIWILGVTSNTVNLLHRYPESDWKENLQGEDVEEDNMFRKLFKSQMG